MKYTQQPRLDDRVKQRAVADSKQVIANGTGTELQLYKKGKSEPWEKFGSFMISLPGIILTMMSWTASSQ